MRKKIATKIINNNTSKKPLFYLPKLMQPSWIRLIKRKMRIKTKIVQIGYQVTLKRVYSIILTKCVIL